MTLVDPDRAAAPHEMVLLTEPVRRRPPGAQVGPVGAGQPAQRPTRPCRRRCATRSPPGAGSARCRRRPPRGSFGFGAIAVRGLRRVHGRGAVLLWMLVPLLPIIITIAVDPVQAAPRPADRRRSCGLRPGRRVPSTYLATAEADQLRFEEGEDIFSKYLPWAIIFELADRWAKICGDLVAMGRLPDTTPYWYFGNYNMLGLQHRLPDQQPGHRGHPGPVRPAAAAPVSAAAARSAVAGSPGRRRWRRRQR